MCVILYKPVNTVIPRETLQSCWQRNPHGSGFMFLNNNLQNPDSLQLVIIKGLMSFDDFLTKYHEYEDFEMVIHFRFASIGEIDTKNTHPFYVFNDPDYQLGFCHNGHINNPLINNALSNTDISDSVALNNEILQKLPKDPKYFIHNIGINRLLNVFLDGGIIVLMDTEGTIKSVGDASNSIIINGVWFSNSYWMDETDETKEENGFTDEDEENKSAKNIESYGGAWDDYGTSCFEDIEDSETTDWPTYSEK